MSATRTTLHHVRRSRSIPRRLRGIVWMRDSRTLDLDRDRVRIIHHVLAYGSLEDWRWLRRTYSLATIRSVFREHPLKVHTPPSLNFASRFLLHVRPPRYADRYLAPPSRRSR